MKSRKDILPAETVYIHYHSANAPNITIINIVERNYVKMYNMYYVYV